MAEKLALDAPLPDELAVARGWLMGYRRYPVFSARWLWRRVGCFAAISGAVAAVMAAATWAARGDATVALASSGYFVAGVIGVSTFGPLLATWVRHRRWGGRRERVGLVVALLVGVAGAAIIDGWASSGIERVSAPPGTLAPTAPGTPAATSPVAAAAASAPTSTSAPVIGAGLALLIYALLGGGLGLGRYFSEERERAELAHRRELAAAQQRERELDARLGLLQAQVEPHFLFNTLASVRSLLAEDPPAAERLIDALVSYLRATIPRLREPAQLESTLGQQLELCTAYLEVMQGRMGGRLVIEAAVDEALRQEKFPPLLLISLVENAVKHGIEPKRGSGRICLGARAEGEALVVTVRDDGVGLQGGMQGSGIGLRNVREALAARYGQAARLSLTGLAEGGVEAEVRVPRASGGAS